MPNDTNTGMSWIWVLFIVLVLYLIFCRGNLFGGDCGANQCNRVSNCEVERRDIINAANTQFLIGQEGAATRTELHNTQDAIMAQASRIYEQGLQEKLFDAKMHIQQLEGNAAMRDYTDGIKQMLSDCCCNFNRRLDSIECSMLKRPPFFPAGNTFQGCPGHC